MDHVILVDEHDNPIGVEDKLRAHEDAGRLHRAFSVFIFNRRGRLLLQRRAAKKYHFAGLWTNTCCSHPREGETVEAAAHRRLAHEMGFDTPLETVFSFVYKAADRASGLTEHEFDHVLVGVYDSDPAPNPDEVEGWKWMDPSEIVRDLRRNPDRYTPWFHSALEKLLEKRGIDTNE